MRPVFFVILTILTALNLWAAEFQVDKSRENLVKFISHAPMDDFEGITDKIDGYLLFDPENPAGDSEMYFEVDLNSIDTGIGLRNRHMRENYLETEQFPFTHFTGKVVEAETAAGGVLKLKAAGKMFIHGVERETKVDGTLEPVDGGYRVQTAFVVKLTDYKIKVPRLMFFKINENMQLELNFFLKNAEAK